jgi:hypothetical protein
VLEEAGDTLRHWADVAERAWRDGEDIADALDRAFSPELDGIDPVIRARLETLNGVHSNAAGFRRWLEHRNASAGQLSTRPADADGL